MSELLLFKKNKVISGHYKVSDTNKNISLNRINVYGLRKDWQLFINSLNHSKYLVMN